MNLICFKRGSTFSFAGYLWDPGQCAPFKLHGCKVEAHIRQRMQHKLIQELDVRILDPEKNSVGVYASAEDTLKWSAQKHYIDFKITDSVGQVLHTATRDFEVVDYVTK